MPPPPDATSGPLGVRRASAADLPAINALIGAAYARYLTSMNKPPGPMLRDYAPSVEAGTTWVTGSSITAVLTLYPRDDHLLVENIAVHPDAQDQWVLTPGGQLQGRAAYGRPARCSAV